MIEMRWLDQKTELLLQFRQKLSMHDFGKGIYDEWSEWIDVPYVEEKDE